MNVPAPDTAADIDPVLVVVLERMLQTVAYEMATALQRTSKSTIFNLVGDFITAICDEQGRTLAQQEHAAIIAFGVEPSLASIVDFFGDDIHDGDVFAHNDVFSGGNQNHDLGIFVPIFTSGRLVGWSVTKGHQADMGGGTAGGYNPAITEVWQEALRVPPVRLVERGHDRRDIWEMLRANVRLDDVMDDLRAMVGAAQVGARRIVALHERYGTTTLERHLDALLAMCEAEVRAEIATWPDGTWSGESWMVSDGIDPTARYRIAVDVTIAGDSIALDFSRTDDQAPGYTNMPSAAAMAAVRIAILMIIRAGGARLSPNHGTFAPITTTFRPGSLLDPGFPAATIFGNQMCDEVFEAIMMALAEPLPDRVTAGWNQALGTVYSGIDPRSGRRRVFFGSYQRGGQGAMSGADGWDAIGFTGAAGQMRNPDVEAYEISHPVIVESYEYWTDSAGAGTWRGGLGTKTVRTLLADDITAATLGDDVEAEDAAPPPGLFGGRPGPLNRLVLEFPDGTTRLWGSKELIEHIPAGTRVVSCNGGGAGYGPPADRPRDLVERDVRDGYVSVQVARDVYDIDIDVDVDVDVDVEDRGTS